MPQSAGRVQSNALAARRRASAGTSAALAIFGADEALRLPWLAVFALLQGLRVWILVSLGFRWTTRIVVVDAPLVARRPYRWLRHPNYLLVVCEIAVAPLVLGLERVALVFSLLNTAVPAIRIRAENRALRPMRAAGLRGAAGFALPAGGGPT